MTAGGSAQGAGSASRPGDALGQAPSHEATDGAQTQRGEPSPLAVRLAPALAKQLREAQRLASLGALARALAHDFNNLLASVLANADLVRRHLESDTPDHRRLSDVITACRAATDLCQQMLACGESESEAVASLSPQTRVALPALIETLRPLLTAVIAEGARLVLELGDVPDVRADGGQLRQVLLNLVTNASDALGGRAGTITIGIRDAEPGRPPPSTTGAGPDPAERMVRLTVSDDGCGLDRETLTRLFDPTFTTKVPAGHGLGLSVVLGIVHTHGGSVDVQSAPGAGTCVTVMLPAPA